MITGTVSQLAYLHEVAELRRDLIASFDQIAHDTIARMGTNVLDCPEVRNYRRETLEGVVIVTYEVRQPGEAEWQSVRIVHLT